MQGLSIDFNQRHPFRRESAVEMSPSKAPANQEADFGVRSNYNRHLSADCHTYQRSQHSPHGYIRTTSELLNPSIVDINIFKKSNESLHKNSSTDTDYSVHPYKVIKQNSNDTTTSMTGSFNIDACSMTADLSLDAESSLTTTVIENNQKIGGGGGSTSFLFGGPKTTPIRTVSAGASDLRTFKPQMSLDQPLPPPRSAMLKKQFSMDHTKYSPKRTVSESDKIDGGIVLVPAQQSPPIQTSTVTSTTVQYSSSTSGHKPPIHKGSLKQPQTTSKMGLNVLLESSSSTEDSKDEHQQEQQTEEQHPSTSISVAAIPTISTNIVQDEIAKLSSNIKSSTDSEKDPPYNETMC